MENNEHIFLYAFDLKTDKESLETLKCKYNKSKQNMYDIIEKHMLKNNFAKIQYSVYKSIDPISKVKLRNIINDLYKENIWLAKFTNKADNAVVLDNEKIDFTKTINRYVKELEKIDTNTISSSKSIKDKYKDDLLNKNERKSRSIVKNIVNSKTR